MPLNVRLRKAAAGDVSRLVRMMEAFNRAEGIVWDPSGAEPAIRRLVDDESLGSIGLIERGVRTVGYFVVTWGYDLEWNGRDAFLTELYLNPAARRQRIGSQALKRIEALSRARGAGALHLMVRPENEAAVKLYRSAGYTSPPRTFLTKDLHSPSMPDPGPGDWSPGPTRSRRYR